MKPVSAGGFYVIGLAGKKGAGKDSVAAVIQAIAERDGDRFVRFAFADPIRREFMSIVGAKTEQEYDRIKRSTAMVAGAPGMPAIEISMRDVMRGIGMLMRSYDEQQFVGEVRRQLLAAYQAHVRHATNKQRKYAVITDVRFDNEIDMLQADFGATIFNVINPADTSSDNHVTERGFDSHKIDALIHNARLNDLPIDQVVQQATELYELVEANLNRFVIPNPY